MPGRRTVCTGSQMGADMGEGVGADAAGASQGDVLGIDAARVTAWLDATVAGASGPYRFTLLAGGHSNLTYRVDTAEGRALVLRRPPRGAILASAHDMAREHRILAGVGRTTVPVPRVLGLCEDETVNGAPFYVMDCVDGVVVSEADITREALPDPATRRALSESVIDALAELHLVDPDGVGLGDLGRKDAYLDRQLRRWSGQWEQSKTRELPEMDEAHRLLVAAKPQQRYSGIVHGDFRLGNLLSDPVAGKVNAVLDWELCTQGDVLADLGYLLNDWVGPDEATHAGATPPPSSAGGFLSRDELVARYSARTGFVVGDINYYRAFQAWRLASISEGVLNRYLQGVMGNEEDTDRFRLSVEGLVAKALDLLAAAR